MAQSNRKTASLRTHEGAKAKHISVEDQLRRSVMSCLLFENEFYENGEAIETRIRSLIPLVEPEKVAKLAVEARVKMKLRHVPLLIVREMARLPEHKKFVAFTLEVIIERPDELTEFLALYWKDKKQPLSAQVKKGLARAFTKFNAYQLGKYNRDKAVKLRDVLFLCHAEPLNDVQADTWKRLVEGTLATPDTWEVALSSGADKKLTWERLIAERKLGGLALLRNLRNMREANVSQHYIKTALSEMKTDRILPYRFIAAARYAPELEPELETAMFGCLKETPRLDGRTCLLVDVSGSMDTPLSTKSDLTRLDAACGLAMLLRETCSDLNVITFSEKAVTIPPRRGFALRDSITQSQHHSGTYLGRAIGIVAHHFDRVIVITDEQSADSVPDPVWPHAYLINVASNKNGVGYGKWRHIDGFSESVVTYLVESEKSHDDF